MKISPLSFLILVLFITSCNKNYVSLNLTEGCVGQKDDATITYPDFITASRHLDLPYLDKSAVNTAQRNYTQILKGLFENQNDTAINGLFELVKDSSDTLIRAEARMLLETILLSESKWSDVLKIHPKSESNTDIYYSHAKAWSTALPCEYVFPSTGVRVPLKFTRNGQALVQIKINGKTFWFLLDTGGQFSMISKKVAAACGINIIPTEGIDSKKIFSNPGIIPSLGIGEGEIRNVPIMITDSKNIDIKLFGIFTLMKIDGIIGWPQLRNLLLEFNNTQNVLHISMSKKIQYQDRNFIFYYRPIVRAIAPNGTPLFFFLDIGKGNTSLFPRGAKKTDLAISNKGITIASMQSPMGGTTIEHTKVIKNANICIGRSSLKFNKIPVEGTDSPFFDGWMGMDIGKGNNLVIDFSDGIVEIQKP